jgi:hypothetical protein
MWPLRYWKKSLCVAPTSKQKFVTALSSHLKKTEKHGTPGYGYFYHNILAG